KKHYWIDKLAVVDLVKVGSIGLKVARILDREADVFAHLSCKLKTWDTAGPAAIALGAGLEVGGMDVDQLLYPLPDFLHNTSIIMGRPGSLAWCRNHLRRNT
ncbi:MAG: inositol monophosphatase family protein, partial [Candidatus Obscuribacterales bacterium]